ncbi:hypothetical protein BS78_10G135900 [Paspalum vaginatum]|nr:hypothetical protein BS78_10G135900 [Paspalum vaginatum]
MISPESEAEVRARLHSTAASTPFRTSPSSPTPPSPSPQPLSIPPSHGRSHCTAASRLQFLSVPRFHASVRSAPAAQAAPSRPPITRPRAAAEGWVVRWAQEESKLPHPNR